MIARERLTSLTLRLSKVQERLALETEPPLERANRLAMERRLEEIERWVIWRILQGGKDPDLIDRPFMEQAARWGS